MLKNYIKMAWKVLKRRKFFTFISLFGISFTILVLMVASSIIDNAINPGGTDVYKSRILLADRIMATDSLKKHVWISEPGYSFLIKYAKTLKTPQLVSIHSSNTYYTTYLNGRKLSFSYKFTDEQFWRIYKFNFLRGKPYSSRELENAEKVAVITRHTAETYFENLNVVGKPIDIDGSDYLIIGVVENVSANNTNTYADIWIPATTSKDDIQNQYFGDFHASILAYSDKDFNMIKIEYHNHLKASVADEKFQKRNIRILKSPLQTRDDVLYDLFINTNYNLESNTTEDDLPELNAGFGKGNIIYLGVGLLMLIFMLLPSINLVNINLSRMTERNSEIGVRKAFGASKKILVGQFITENLILTFIGGAISLVLTIITLNILNSSGYIPYAHLALNLNLFIIGIIICLVFGFISGVYPAYRMSKLHPIEALRGGEQ